ncbi:MAG: TIGR02710 family CRISPR-associated protein [Deltaproteobacteria bacterium]|nr:TIGR02710 family CRISPR-associated protein [Deltaproteobacteria bacterium]
MQKKKILVMSVGGSVEPCKAVKRECNPDITYFVVSQGSACKTAEIGHVSTDKIYPLTDYTNTVTCADECYKLLSSIDLKTYDVMVDITGGTKAMSAGLGYAALQLGLPTSYVDGAVRDKDGLGVVVGGSTVRTFPNIWHHREQRQMARYFKTYDWNAANDLAKSVIASVENTEGSQNVVIKKEFEAYLALIDFLRAWDLFDYVGAKKKIVEVISCWNPIQLVGDEYQKIRLLLGAVQKRVESIKNQLPTPEICVDLYLNARRRYEEGLYDDALARLYRFIELVVQYLLDSHFEIKTGEVDLSKIPDGFMVPDDRKLPLRKSWDLFCLKAPDSPFSKMFAGNEKLLFGEKNKGNGILQKRNHSMLAHGYEPISHDVVDQALEQMKRFFDLLDADKQDLFAGIVNALPW